MAVKDLVERRERIVRERMESMGRINQEILKLTNAAMRDTRTGVKAGLGVKGFLDALLNIGRDSELKMDSRDRLEFARLWFQNAESMRRSVAEDPGYASLMKDIDAQLDLYRKELARLDEELRLAETEEKRVGVRKDRDMIREAR